VKEFEALAETYKSMEEQDNVCMYVHVFLAFFIVSMLGLTLRSKHMLAIVDGYEYLVLIY